MSAACTRFRAELEQALAGAPAGLARLARHPHALECGACRRELARERDLDRLLDAVPVPVPPALARRVLAGLADQREGRPGVAEFVPEHGAEGAGDDELAQLLAALPVPAVPAGLSARVLQGLAPVRNPRAPRRSARVRLWLAAAGLLVAAALWAWTRRRPILEPAVVVEQTPAELPVDLEADEELLAYAVERWELLHDEDLDVWLASLDPADEILMEVAQDEGWFLDGVRTGESDDGAGSGPGRGD